MDLCSHHDRFIPCLVDGLSVSEARVPLAAAGVSLSKMTGPTLAAASDCSFHMAGSTSPTGKSLSAGCLFLGGLMPSNSLPSPMSMWFLAWSWWACGPAMRRTGRGGGGTHSRSLGRACASG